MFAYNLSDSTKLFSTRTAWYEAFTWPSINKVSGKDTKCLGNFMPGDCNFGKAAYKRGAHCTLWKGGAFRRMPKAQLYKSKQKIEPAQKCCASVFSRMITRYYGPSIWQGYPKHLNNSIKQTRRTQYNCLVWLRITESVLTFVKNLDRAFIATIAEESFWLILCQDTLVQNHTEPIFAFWH